MANTTRTTPRIIGSLRALDDASLDKGVVQMRDRFTTSIDDLWSAMTEPDRVARWIGEVDGDLSVGGTFTARLTSHWEGPARVDVCDAPHRLVITMRPGQDDETVFEARLSESDGGTDLVIEESGLPLSEIFAHGAGWQAHVEDLQTHIAGREPGAWVDRWNELAPTYEAMAASLGGSVSSDSK
ncbi:SRPBCC domain-containing protein [Glaciihabitans sp. dw_435]|uniref:SRPBCC domain-containing protein n=1 Tax=Glaciihabitans sp. dw_435 TaxID=2720081 RepID=UPI001BD69889|nr:SRPBCC domain-containing protein [Glaciihabitans sp. dw_435]